VLTIPSSVSANLVRTRTIQCCVSDGFCLSDERVEYDLKEVKNLPAPDLRRIEGNKVEINLRTIPGGGRYPGKTRRAVTNLVGHPQILAKCTPSDHDSLKESMAWGWFLRARALIDDRKWQVALAPLDKAVSLMPKNCSYLITRAFVRERLGRLKAAAEDEARAVSVKDECNWQAAEHLREELRKQH
jgi:tetratricopeptide (TPR) repeat protein